MSVTTVQYKIPSEFEPRMRRRAEQWGLDNLNEVGRRLAILADYGLSPGDHGEVSRWADAIGGTRGNSFTAAAAYFEFRSSNGNASSR